MPQYVLREQPHNEIKSTWPLYERVGVWVYHTIVPWIVYLMVKLLTSTYRWRQMVSKELLDLMSSGRPFAVAIWHGDMLLSQSLGKRLGWTGRTVIMVALNQAGEVETRILKRLGYYVVRGSEKKRGKEALEDMKDILNQGAIAAMVVDGPIGPAREVKAGVIELARFCQVPIVPVSFMPGNEWILPTWDKTRIPKPFSRCITTSTIPVTVPSVLSEEEFEAAGADVKAVLEDLEKRNIGWDEALSLNVKLLGVFGVRNSIERIRNITGRANPGTFTDDQTIVARILDELKLIVSDLGEVKKRHFERVNIGTDWKQMREIRRIIKRTCKRGDTHEIGVVVNELIPELNKYVEEIIRRTPVLAPNDVPRRVASRHRQSGVSRSK